MRFVKFGIVGTGPSGLYLGKYLSKYVKNCKVDYFEKSKHLLGLFKTGVAPDKQTIKQNSFQLLHNPNYRFFTNIHIGLDISLELLLEYYNVIFLCCGCEDCNEFKIPNEHFGVFNNLKLIHYYNNYNINNLYHNLTIHPINRTREGAKVVSAAPNSINTTLKVSGEGATTIFAAKDTVDSTINSAREENNHTQIAAVGINDIEAYLEYLTGLKSVNIGILGTGNVCLDIIRMLVKSKEELEQLQINPKFIQFVNSVKIKRITVFGRSSLQNSKFTNHELQTLFQHNILSTHTNSINNSVDRVNTINSVNSNNRKELKKVKLFNTYSNSYSNTPVTSGDSSDRVCGDRIWVDFKFNTRIIKIINNTQNIIKSILYTTNSTVNSVNSSNIGEGDTTVFAAPNTHNSTVKVSGEGATTNSAAPNSNTVNSINSIDLDILIKCIGYNNKSNSVLLSRIDNVRVFGHGWVVNNCKGDLANIILNSIHLSNHIKQLFSGEFHYYNNDILHFFKQHKYIK